MRRDDSIDGAARRAPDARLTVTIGTRATLEVAATTGGLLAIGALVSGILLSSAAIVWTARE